MPLQPHQERVVQERSDLVDEIEKLDKFIRISEVYQKLDKQNQNLLVDQLKHMCVYSNILLQRINLF